MRQAPAGRLPSARTVVDVRKGGQAKERPRLLGCIHHACGEACERRASLRGREYLRRRRGSGRRLLCPTPRRRPLPFAQTLADSPLWKVRSGWKGSPALELAAGRWRRSGGSGGGGARGARPGTLLWWRVRGALRLLGSACSAPQGRLLQARAASILSLRCCARALVWGVGTSYSHDPMTLAAASSELVSAKAGMSLPRCHCPFAGAAGLAAINRHALKLSKHELSTHDTL